ncbi:hypothetical protein [Halomonas lysinitropha]|uniref:Uncharacterized protein n=1 Tax=Halomonas lysinitropha TaxID=2607506 RepID=A0A5K1I5U5_9GAMM|nr:hypothetical protein [Halomonas lysinitropha]VVZ96745.1 hypothetical protein HALO32_02852 [Halomonas lysinitropha]
MTTQAASKAAEKRFAWITEQDEKQEAYLHLKDLHDHAKAQANAARKAADKVAAQAPETGMRRIGPGEREQEEKDYQRDVMIAERKVTEAESVLAELAQQKELANQAWEAAIEKEPKATKAELEALEADVTRAEDREASIREAMAKAGDTGEAMQAAQGEIEQAQRDLDDLAADAALGVANQAQQRKTTAALEDARGRLREAQEEAHRQAAARRGLEKRLAAAEAEAEELRMLRDSLESDLLKEEHARLEDQLMAFLQGDDFRRTLANLAEIRAKMNRRSGPYQRWEGVRLRVELPALYDLPGRPRILEYQGDTMKVTG